MTSRVGESLPGSPAGLNLDFGVGRSLRFLEKPLSSFRSSLTTCSRFPPVAACCCTVFRVYRFSMSLYLYELGNLFRVFACLYPLCAGMLLAIIFPSVARCFLISRGCFNASAVLLGDVQLPRSRVFFCAVSLVSRFSQDSSCPLLFHVPMRRTSRGHSILIDSLVVLCCSIFLRTFPSP